MTDEDDLNLPRAAINKLIKETLPQVSRIADYLLGLYIDRHLK